MKVDNKWEVEFDEHPIEPIRNKNYRGLGNRQGSQRGWDIREFIAWDGEGVAFREPIDEGHGLFHWEEDRKIFQNHKRHPQDYVLLANSKDQILTAEHGIRTVDCFEFILNTKRQFPLSIFVGFGFNYDVNQILRDVPKSILETIHEKNAATVGNYYVRWRPGKSFYIKHPRTMRSAIIYDTLGYFQMSFLKTCEKYLGKNDPALVTIQRGKDARELFEWEELEDFIIPYCKTELAMLVRIMQIVRRDFHAVAIDPSEWYGPGAVANKVFRKHSIPISREIPSEVLDASQFAYAGGRFEPFWLGRSPYSVWEYDIHSAYPEATTYLPDLSTGTWEHAERFEPGSFGIWSIDYRADRGINGGSEPGPLFCRAENGSISYPSEVQGWYHTPEAELVSDYVKEGYVFRSDSDSRPFAFVAGLYEQRRLLQEQKNSLERALKLILNSLYGKLAQTVGGRDGPPRWHQLEYAGFITSYTRAKIYRAIMLNPEAIIAVETDAVFSREPLDLPTSDNLGDWKETIFDEICYIQSGFYYAVADGEVICKYRGMDRDRKTEQPVGLSYREVLDHLRKWTGHKDIPPSPLVSTTQRFIGLGAGLRTNAVWRSWEKKARVISLAHRRRNTKRIHIINDCPRCQTNISMADMLHPTQIGGHSGQSFARPLPWRKVETQSTNIDWEEYKEMLMKVDDERWT